MLFNVLHPVTDVLIRPFQLTDSAGVNALHDDIGWPAPSDEQWQWLASNPARGVAPMGWVIDNGGRIDGFIGSFRINHYRNTQRYRTATGHSVTVSPRVKGSLRELIAPFMSQADLFAVSVLNANATGSNVYERLGFKPFATPLHDLKLSWTISPVITTTSKVVSAIAGQNATMQDLLGERFSPRSAAMFDARLVKWPSGIHPVSDLSDNSAYGDFWNALKTSGKLVADRSPATLRWRMSIPGLSARPLLLGYHDDKGMCAYAMAQMSKTAPLDVTTLEIIDIVQLDRAPAKAVPTLIRALYIAGTKMGAAKVRIPVVTPDIMKALGNKLGSATKEGGWGHAFAHHLQPQSEYTDWQPTAFEGSYAFTLRQPRCKSSKIKRRRGERAMAVSET